jgi:2,3,4,5-tetrahydropyridine-2,6-dicarboxylate N-acetyltransferase
MKEAKVYVEASVGLDTSGMISFSSFPLYIVIGKIDELKEWLIKNEDKILNYYFEFNFKNSLMPLFNLANTKARIEPGAVIRDGVFIHDEAIILMGAVVNTNASIGRGTMIDMNAVVGSGALIGEGCHIGAGAVIAGVLEPVSDCAVIIEDNVLIGANAVILEGVHVKENAIVGAGAVVTKDVAAGSTVVGVPAREIKGSGEWKINETLRRRL